MSPILDVVAPRMLAPAVMVAVALMVKGYVDVGEGFGAGVIVALAVSLRYVTLGAARADRTLPIAKRADVIAAVGLLIAFASGFWGVLVGRPPFTHWPPPGADVPHLGTLELMTAVAFDVGIFLLVLGLIVLLVRSVTGLIPGDDLAADGADDGDVPVAGR